MLRTTTKSIFFSFNTSVMAISTDSWASGSKLTAVGAHCVVFAAGWLAQIAAQSRRVIVRALRLFASIENRLLLVRGTERSDIARIIEVRGRRYRCKNPASIRAVPLVTPPALSILRVSFGNRFRSKRGFILGEKNATRPVEYLCESMYWQKRSTITESPSMAVSNVPSCSDSSFPLNQ